MWCTRTSLFDRHLSLHFRKSERYRSLIQTPPVFVTRWVQSDAAQADSGRRVTLEASYAKLFCSQAGMRVVDRALQILGGYGFIREFPVERMYRDVKGIEFGAGTTQIQKLIIVRELLRQAGVGK